MRVERGQDVLVEIVMVMQEVAMLMVFIVAGGGDADGLTRPPAVQYGQ
jgi:hypothetical protein